MDYSPEDEAIVGRAVGITDIVGFHGESVAEMVPSFHAAVDSSTMNFETKAELPQKPYSGQVMFRIPPELQFRAASAAAAAGKRLNQWATEAIERTAAQLKRGFQRRNTFASPCLLRTHKNMGHIAVHVEPVTGLCGEMHS